MLSESGDPLPPKSGAKPFGRFMPFYRKTFVYDGCLDSTFLGTRHALAESLPLCQLYDIHDESQATRLLVIVIMHSKLPVLRGFFDGKDSVSVLAVLQTSPKQVADLSHCLLFDKMFP